VVPSPGWRAFGARARGPQAGAPGRRSRPPTSPSHPRDKFFPRRYMADIGHYEFGALHRPIRFPGLEDLLEGRDERTLDYWLAYWVAAFEHVRTRRHKVRIVPYEALCGDGPTVFRELCGQLGVGDAQAVARASEIFRRRTDHAVSTDEVDEDLRMSSQALYTDLGGNLDV